MRKINKKYIFLMLTVSVLITSTSVYASETFSSLFPTISSESQNSVRVVEDRLTQSWAKGQQILLKSEDLSNYKFINITQLDDELSSFSMQERSSFLEAFYSEERANNLDVGDYMSALLIDRDKSRALVYWEKANGSYVVIELKTKSDDSHSWYVNGVEIKPNT